MARHKNGDWVIPEKPNWDQAQTALLMDIRDELQQLNRTLACHNFQTMPNVLKRIDRRLQKSGMTVNNKRKKKK